MTLFAPAPNDADIDPEQIKRATDAMVDDLLDRLRAVVEGGDRRHYDGAAAGGEAHQRDVPGVQGCLTQHQHDPATLLETDVRRARDQIVVVALCDGTQGLHRAGRDEHSKRPEGARGDRGTKIGIMVAMIGKRFDVRNLPGCFLADRPPRGGGNHKMRFDQVQLPEMD